VTDSQSFLSRSRSPVETLGGSGRLRESAAPNAVVRGLLDNSFRRSKGEPSP
jgi:hypothetical protein